MEHVDLLLVPEPLFLPVLALVFLLLALDVLLLLDLVAILNELIVHLVVNKAI